MQNRNKLRFRGFTGGSLIKNLPANAGDVGSILGQEVPLNRKWQSTPIFLPGKVHGQRRLGGYSSWCCKESDKIYAHTKTPSILRNQC